ncbi:hypothetical protein [Blastococcus sp. LR1]|uniref:hypothetical protein n=1 Tax=Blastococcus sp. LR1 TaxID=2877000 RepID=UPI001CCE4E1B|nr:hypothetical protein [Blastococcus sp. LR1]MCA0145600.1 hypothetical protein [Blastococcus sp. LR1]
MLDQYLDPGDGQHEARLGLVSDVFIHGRPWPPGLEGERLLVEAAMVVHGTTVRAHGIMNAAAAVRTHRA